MADKEEAKEESTEEETEKKEKKSPLVLIIIIVVLILIILIGAVVAILFMGGDEEQPPAAAPVQQSVPANNVGTSRSGGGSSSGLPVGETFDKIGVMFPLDTFTVNLLSESGRKYLKVQMNLELGGEELAAELDGKKAVIRDIIIRILSSKSLEEISTMKGKDKLKQQIVDALNARLVDGKIKNVYFTDFVIQ